LLANAINRLDRLNTQVADYIALAKRKDFEQRIQDLKTKLADAQQKAVAARQAAVSPTSFLVSLIGLLVTAGSDVGAVITALTVLDSKITSGDVSTDSGLGKAISDTGDIFQKLEALINGPAKDAPDVKAIAADLKKLLTAYDAFEQESNQIKQELLAISYSDVLQAFSARSSLENKLATNSAEFHDLLRTALINYLLDVAREPQALRTNLQGVSTFLNRFPVEDPYFKLSDISRPCVTAADPCLTLQPSTAWRVIQGFFPLGSKNVVLPLYVVAPRTTIVTLPLYGITTVRTDQSTKPPVGAINRPLFNNTTVSFTQMRTLRLQ
jgi:hypothetical protein